MYPKLINKIKELGDALAGVAGNVADIGIKKSWLTEWDIKIETELSGLIHTFPGEHSIFAEEISDTFYSAENVWIIDPISNTFNFIYGFPHYSIVLSHLHKGKLVFAVVYDPSSRELFTAEKNKGAFLNSRPIKVSDRIQDLAILAGSHLTPQGKYRAETIGLLDKLSLMGTIRTFGSLGVHYAYVACGRADAAVSLNKDVFPEFAGKLLVEEAGGTFTDLTGQALIVQTHGVVASNGKIHQVILGGVK